MKKLMMLAAMLAMVLAVAIPAVAQQGGDQESVNVANAENNCVQDFEQNQVAVQENNIYQDADQNLEQFSIAAALALAGDDLIVDDEGNLIVAAESANYAAQVGNVAVPVQYVNQEGAAEQNCVAVANAGTIQYQNNVR